jgi:hypothetical protein
VCSSNYVDIIVILVAYARKRKKPLFGFRSSECLQSKLKKYTSYTEMYLHCKVHFVTDLVKHILDHCLPSTINNAERH